METGNNESISPLNYCKNPDFLMILLYEGELQKIVCGVQNPYLLTQTFFKLNLSTKRTVLEFYQQHNAIDFQ